MSQKLRKITTVFDFTLNGLPALVISGAEAQPATCYGRADGSLTIHASGGIGQYIFKEPSTTYECRVQGFQGNYSGSYSEIQTFTTPGVAVLACGAGRGLRLPLAGQPLTDDLPPGAVFTAGDFTVTVDQCTNNGSGHYSGRGTIPILYLGSIMRVTFDDITIDASRQLVAGQIKAVGDDIKEWEAQQLAAQDLRKYDRGQDAIAKQNQETYGKDLDLYKTAASFPGCRYPIGEGQ